jgi:predicted short-subunit dehydrogenase-like oxidoreductase (DUF2520 family)
MAHALDRCGHTIIQVISPHVEHAKELATKFGAFFGDHYSELYSDADLVIISVNDDAYAQLSKTLLIPGNPVVCHTSGAIPMDVLQPLGPNYGVLYPLQSFNKHTLKSFDEVPLMVEGVDGKVERLLQRVADDLSNTVRMVSSEDRKRYHLAAVFANNFTNLMYDCAERYLDNQSLDFDMLKPIIFETALRIRNNRPKDVQTGPAKRKDQKVIDEHLKMIQQDELQAVYRELSELIGRMH